MTKVRQGLRQNPHILLTGVENRTKSSDYYEASRATTEEVGRAMTTKEYSTSEAIKLARQLVGMTPTQMAEALTASLGEEITTEVYYNIEQGRRRIDDRLLKAIAEVQQIDVRFYLYGPGDLLEPFRLAVTRAKGVWLRATPSMSPAA
jgi:hypothetical protein